MARDKEQWIRMKPTKQDVAAFEAAFNSFASNIHSDLAKVKPDVRNEGQLPAGTFTDATQQEKSKLLAAMDKVNIDAGLSRYIIGKVRSHTEETGKPAHANDVTFAQPLADGSKNLQELIKNMKQGKFLKLEPPHPSKISEADYELKAPTHIAVIKLSNTKQI